MWWWSTVEALALAKGELLVRRDDNRCLRPAKVARLFHSQVMQSSSLNPFHILPFAALERSATLAWAVENYVDWAII